MLPMVVSLSHNLSYVVTVLSLALGEGSVHTVLIVQFHFSYCVATPTFSLLVWVAFVRWITTCTTKNKVTCHQVPNRRCERDATNPRWQKPATVYLETADSWVEKAIYCFQQADDTERASKARVFRASIRFRSMLEQQNVKATSAVALDHTDFEPKMTRLVKNLLKEQLVSEAVLLCRVSHSFLPSYSRDKVNDFLICSLLKGADADDFDES